MISKEQILIGSILGDGHISSKNTFSTGSKFKEYVDFKSSTLEEYGKVNYSFLKENGYSKTPYHRLSLTSNEFERYRNMGLKDLLSILDESGLAIWIYDDGSLHKSNLFYNLNTHSFSLEQHKTLIIPELRRFNIEASIFSETKPDGKQFYYTSIPKKYGAQTVNNLLKRYPIDCYKYKTYDGNINDTLTVKCIKTKDVISGKITIHPGITFAAKYLKSCTATLNKYLGTNKVFKNHTIDVHYYE